jgi:hypothetical protein
MNRREMLKGLADVGETNNLMDKKPDLAASLQKTLSDWRQQVGALPPVKPQGG